MPPLDSCHKRCINISSHIPSRRHACFSAHKLPFNCRCSEHGAQYGAWKLQASHMRGDAGPHAVVHLGAETRQVGVILLLRGDRRGQLGPPASAARTCRAQDPAGAKCPYSCMPVLQRQTSPARSIWDELGKEVGRRLTVQRCRPLHGRPRATRSSRTCRSNHQAPIFLWHVSPLSSSACTFFHLHSHAFISIHDTMLAAPGRDHCSASKAPSRISYLALLLMDGGTAYN